MTESDFIRDILIPNLEMVRDAAAKAWDEKDGDGDREGAQFQAGRRQTADNVLWLIREKYLTR